MGQSVCLGKGMLAQLEGHAPYSPTPWGQQSIAALLHPMHFNQNQ